MSGRKQSTGTCAYCGVEIAKSGVARHLSSCTERRAAVEKAECKKVKSETLYFLRAQDAWRPEFWLDLEMPGSRTLKDLDFYLRGIWLECCGHMSRFSIGGWRGAEISKRRRIEEVFEPGVALTHIYDFGTSSETLIKALSTREGKPTNARPVAVLARNRMPEARCIECGKRANWLCMECLIEEETWGALCDDHARTHPHENYGESIRLVNSPRLGMCGYDGPAEPPY